MAKLLGGTIVYGTGTVQTILYVQGTTNSTNTASGALQVVGGAGIGRDLYVGGTIYGTFFGSITGTATTATNIAAGSAGLIPIQSSTGTTAFINTGSVGNLLQFQSGNTATFVSTSTLQVGYSIYANTATNVAGGTAGQLHYQSAVGITSFVSTGTAGNVLVSNGTSAPTYNNTLTLAGTANATSTTTGALQVYGGTGIGGNLWVGGRMSLGTTTNDNTLEVGGAIATNGVGTIQFGRNSYGLMQYGGTTNGLNLQSFGSVSAQPGTFSVVLRSSNLSILTTPIFVSTTSQIILSGSDAGGTPTTNSTATVVINGSAFISTATAATSTSTGALTVVGGVGIGGNVFVGGNTNIAGITTVTNVTNATSTASGALQVWGGVGIGGDLRVGGTIFGVFSGSVTGTATTATNIAGGSAGSIPIQSNTGTTAFISTGSVGNLLQQQLGNTATFVSTSTLQVGYSVTATNVAAGTAGQLHYQSAVGVTNFVSTGTVGQLLMSSGTSAPLFVNTASVVVGNAANIAAGTAGQLVYQSSTGTTGFVSTGSVGQLLMSSGTSAPLYVNTSSIVIGNAANIAGGLPGYIPIQSGAGTTAFIATGTVGYLLQMQLGNTATWVSTASIVSPLSNTATNIAGGVSGQLVYQSAPGVTSFVSTGTAGNVLVSNGSGVPTYNNTLTLASTLATVSTNSGALQVAGGVGIGGDVYLGDNFNQVGGTYGTLATTYNLINTTATTVNFAGAATALTMGASASGTTTVRNNLTVAGNLTIQGTTTIVDSTVTNIADPIITLGGGAGNTVQATDDNKDRGIAFKWNTGGATRTGFFGYQDSTGYFTFITSASIVNEVVTPDGGSTKGALDAYLAGGTAQSLVYQSSPNVTSFLAAGTSGYILQTNGTGSAPSWVPGSGLTAGSANTATNIAGGTAGLIPIQSNIGVTAFISTGSVGSLLQQQIGNTATFVSTGTLQVGYSVTATNIAAGTAGQLHYQSSSGVTNFVSTGTVGQLLMSSGTSAPLYVNTASIVVGNAANIAGGTTGQVPYQSGIGQTSFYGPGTIGQLLMSSGTSAPLYVNTSSIVIGNAANIAGGIAGLIPIQSGVGTTAFINAGTAVGQLLQWQSGSTATWISTGSLTAGIATTATQLYTVSQVGNASYYPTFVNANNAGTAGMSFYTTGSFSINPSTGGLTIGNAGNTALTVSGTSSFGSVGTLNGDMTVANAFNLVNGVSGGSAMLLTSGAVGGGTSLTMSNTGGSTGTNWKFSVGGWNQSGSSGAGINEGNLVISYFSTTTMIIQKNTGFVSIGSTLPTAALTVSGGAAISGISTLTNTTNASSTNSGALQVVGGVGIGGTLYVGALRADATTSATTFSIFYNPVTKELTTSTSGIAAGSATTSSLVQTVGTATNAAYYPTFVSANNTSPTGMNVYTTSSLSINPNTGVVIIASTASSTSTSTGALQVYGGIGVGGNVNIAGYVVGGSIRTTSTSTPPPNPTVGDMWYYTLGDTIYRYTYDGTNSQWVDITGPTVASSTATSGGSATTSSLVQTVGTATNASYFPTFVSANNASPTGMAEFTTSSFSINPNTGVVALTSTAAATSTSTGALTVAGGVGIGGTLYVGALRADATTSATTYGIFYNAITKELTTATSSSGSGGSASITISNKTSAYTVVAGDAGTIINCTAGTFTVSLTAAATLGSGFNVTIWNISTTPGDNITIDPAGAETIDGVATLILRPGEGMQVICNGTNWYTGAKKVMRMYAENFADSTQARPVASGNFSLALGRNATASGVGSFAYNYGSVANNDYTIAMGAATLASGAYATAIGGNSFTAGAQAVGIGAVSLGASYASGTDSFAAGISSNASSSGARATGAVALGNFSNANASGAVAIGNSASATGQYSMALGFQTTVTAAGSFAFGATTHLYQANATAVNSFAFGAAAQAVLTGKLVISGGDLIAASTYQQGLQTGIQVLRGQTIDATAKVLVSDTGLAAAGALNQVILPNNSAFAFTGTIVARQQAAGGTASAAWRVEGLIRREGTAASTVLVSSSTNTISNVPGWAIALTADTTNGGLAVTVTGAAATNIRWVATIQTSEVTYA